MVVCVLQNLHFAWCFFFVERSTNSLWSVYPNSMTRETEDMIVEWLVDWRCNANISQYVDCFFVFFFVIRHTRAAAGIASVRGSLAHNRGYRTTVLYLHTYTRTVVHTCFTVLLSRFSSGFRKLIHVLAVILDRVLRVPKHKTTNLNVYLGI